MSEVSETIEINDQELLDHALNDTPAAAEVTDAKPEPARDETGRFAAKPEVEAKPGAQPDPEGRKAQPETEANVPSWRLREERERAERSERQALDLQRQFEELQRSINATAPKKEPTNFFDNPDGAISERLTPLEGRFNQLASSLTLRASRAEAVSEYGKEQVGEMEKAVNEAMASRHPGLPVLRAQMLQSDHPVGVAMDWFRREKLLNETGGDLTKYREKTLADALNDPEFLAKAMEAARAKAGGNQSAPNVVKLPPSLNKATAAASPHEAAGDMSDQSLYEFATR